MYYVFYFTITVLCAVISKLFYCILLTDVIKRSEVKRFYKTSKNNQCASGGKEETRAGKITSFRF